jgi:DedD protein
MAQEQQDVDTLKRRGRRRLVGAVALVLLAVIVLPMVFDQEPRPPAPPVSVRIPGEEETPFKPKPPAAKNLEKKEAEKREAAKKEAAKEEVAKEEVAKGAAEFIVPVGAFTNPEGVVAKLKAAKLPHYTERLPGNVTRVRAGPFPTKDAAEKALQKLKGLGLEPGAVTTKSG